VKSIIMTGAGVISPAGIGASFMPKPEGLADWGDAKLPDLKPSDYGWNGLSRQSRIGKYAMLAIGESFRSAGVHVPIAEPALSERTALVVHTCNSTLEPIMSLYREAEEYGVNHVNPGIFPDTVLNAIGGHASIYFRITGPNVTVSNISPTALLGIQYANDLLSAGQVDRVMCCAIHIHPPERMRNLAGGHSGPESIVALLFERDDGCLAADAHANAVRIGWQGPFKEAPALFPVVPHMHSFLALASLWRMTDDRYHSPNGLRFAARQPEGYYAYMPIPTRTGDGEHA
jgi:hypothetical protein